MEKRQRPGFKLEDKFGMEKCKSSTDTLVFHPRSMQTVWQPEVERLFYVRHRKKCLERFILVDQRLCQFVLQEKLETDESPRHYIMQSLESVLVRSNGNSKTLKKEQ
jgi:hypothetical protein